MNYANRVHVGDTLHNLLEQVLGILLRQLSSLSHVVKEVTTRTEFHHDQVVFGRLEGFHQLDVTRVLDGLEDVDLLHHLALRALFLDLIFIRRLYRN